MNEWKTFDVIGKHHAIKNKKEEAEVVRESPSEWDCER